MRNKPRIVFMGTPEIAATVLSQLLSDSHDIVAVFTREDKPKGRGGNMTSPPVKLLAEEKGIPVYQPKTLRDAEVQDTLKALCPDIIAVVAYGRILPAEVLSVAPFGCVNLHVSLLPKYRGAAPMQRAVMNGDKETGVTTMLMNEGLDTGDILLVRRFPIGARDTFETVHDTSAAIGGPLLSETLTRLYRGEITPVKQNEDGASYAAKIEKSDQLLDFSLPASELDCRIRGLYPFPLAYTKTPDGRLLKILSAIPTNESGEAGTVIFVDGKGDGSITVACGEGALRILTVIPEGKGKMAAGDLVRGRKISVGERLL